MKKPVTVATCLIALTLAAGSYGLHAQATAQAPKNDVRLQFEFKKDGKVLATPAVRVADGGSNTMTLSDGTLLTFTATVIADR